MPKSVGSHQRNCKRHSDRGYSAKTLIKQSQLLYIHYTGTQRAFLHSIVFLKGGFGVWYPLVQQQNDLAGLDL